MRGSEEGVGGGRWAVGGGRRRKCALLGRRSGGLEREHGEVLCSLASFAGVGRKVWSTPTPHRPSPTAPKKLPFPSWRNRHDWTACSSRRVSDAGVRRYRRRGWIDPWRRASGLPASHRG